MKTQTYLIYALYAALAMPLVSCHNKGNAERDTTMRKIDVAVATTDSVILHKTYPGYLKSKNSAKVVGRVDGRLLSVNYNSGEYVTKGTVLFRIDPTLYQDAVARAEAALASAISARDYAKSHYAAVNKALEANAVSKMEVLSAESAYNQAVANIKDCEAALHTARTNLGYCIVTAPISGFTTDCMMSAGNYVNGSGAPVELATIYDISTFNAVFQIEDAQYERLVGRDGGMGAPVYRQIPLSFTDSMTHSYTADLYYESPSVNQSTGTIELKGTVNNIDNELKDGMYVTVSLPYGRKSDAILVKDASIGTDQLGKYLYVVNDSNKVVYTPVEVGDIYQDSLRVITKGLRAGDKYVTKALLTVRNGEEISPVIVK